MVQLKYIYILYMITLKLFIYSLILFILFFKISSCENNIIDLLKIILVIILFNLILENIINTNLQENYEPITNNNYSSIGKLDKNNNYDYKEINDEDKPTIEKSNNENEKDTSEEKDENKSNDDKKEKTNDKINNQIENIKEQTNNIVNVIKDNVKNIIDNNNLTNNNIFNKNEPKLDNKFIYGYSYLHTDNWSLPEKRKPICKNIKPCKICPHKTDGFNPYLLNYNNIYNEKKK